MFEPAILPIVTAENMQHAEVIVQVTCMTCMVEAGALTAGKNTILHVQYHWMTDSFLSHFPFLENATQ
jgi:hypothetical protein